MKVENLNLKSRKHKALLSAYLKEDTTSSKAKNIEAILNGNFNKETYFCESPEGEMIITKSDNDEGNNWSVIVYDLHGLNNPLANLVITDNDYFIQRVSLNTLVKQFKNVKGISDELNVVFYVPACNRKDSLVERMKKTGWLSKGFIFGISSYRLEAFI